MLFDLFWDGGVGMQRAVLTASQKNKHEWQEGSYQKSSCNRNYPIKLNTDDAGLCFENVGFCKCKDKRFQCILKDK